MNQAPVTTLASFLKNLWLKPGKACRGLGEHPGLWQGLLLALLAVQTASFLLWMWIGPWASFALHHPLVLNGPSLESAVPAALDQQRQALWWHGVAGIAIWLPLWALIQGWIVWIAAQWLQKSPGRTYGHGMAAVLGSHIASIPFAALAAFVAWHYSGFIGIPGSGMSIGFGLKIEVDTLPASHHELAGPLLAFLLLALPSFFFSWIAARETLGLKGWRGVLVAMLAL